MKKLYITLLGVFLGLCVYGQEGLFRVKGKIINTKGKALAGARITFLPTDRDYFVKTKGNFDTWLLPKKYTIVIQKQRYITDTIRIYLSRDTTMVFTLRENLYYIPPASSHYTLTGNPFELREVTVIGQKNDKLNLHHANIERLSQSQIDRLPTFLGEKDPVKMIQLLPGVQSQSEGGTEYSVKGGKPDQNLILMDGMPLYSISHFFGLVSTFNPMMVDELRLYKSDAPATYGGRVSSFLDVKTYQAALEGKNTDIELGLLSAKLKIDRVLIKDKWAFSVGARRSFLDVFALFGAPVAFNFADINLSSTFKINPKHSLSLSVYREADGMKIIPNLDDPTKVNIHKDQSLGVLNWQANYSKNISTQLKLGATAFDNLVFQTRITDPSKLQQHFKSNITDVVLKPEITYHKDSLNIQLGVENLMHWINTGNYSESSIDGNRSSSISGVQKLWEWSPFVQIGYSPFARTYISAGLRNSHYRYAQGQYQYWEPRVLLSQEMDRFNTLKLSYAQLSQGVQRLVNSGLGVPFDLILAPNAAIKPQVSHNFSINYIRQFEWKNEKYTLNIEPYYRTIQHALNYQDGYDSRSLIVNSVLPQSSVAGILATGDSKIYGADIMLEKNSGRLTGWLSYSYLKARGSYPLLNNGKSFAEDNDRTQQFNMVFNYQFSDAFSLGLTWTYMTGRPINFNNQVFAVPPTGINAFNNPRGNPYYLFGPQERNSQRMIPFHKLDIAANFNTAVFGRKGVISLGLYNVYNRANANYYYLGEQVNAQGQMSPVLKSVSFFHILPTFSIRFNLNKKITD